MKKTTKTAEYPQITRIAQIGQGNKPFAMPGSISPDSGVSRFNFPVLSQSANLRNLWMQLET
jgi:hypothetical protein